MTDYTFTTRVSMKPYNWDKYWIDSNIVSSMTIAARSAAEALDEWRKLVTYEGFVEVSATAVRRKQPMYRDNPDGTSRQVGYVITGSTEILKGRYRVDPEVYVKQYVDLWVEITQSIPFEEMEA